MHVCANFWICSIDLLYIYPYFGNFIKNKFGIYINICMCVLISRFVLLTYYTSILILIVSYVACCQFIVIVVIR